MIKSTLDVAFPRSGGSYQYGSERSTPTSPILMIESAIGVEQLADWLHCGLVECITRCVHQRRKCVPMATSS